MCRGHTSLETDAFVSFVACIDMLLVRSNLSARSRKEGTQGAVAILRRERVQGCVAQNSDPMNSILRKARELGLNASAGHTMKFLGCTWYETKFGKEKGQSGGIIQKRRTSWAKSLRAWFWGTNTSRQADCDCKVAWNLENKLYNVEQGSFELRKNGHFAENVQKPYDGTDRD